MKTSRIVIQDGDLIEMTRRQIDSISNVAKQLKQEADSAEYMTNGLELEELSKRLESYLVGLRRTIDLLETRIVRAR